MIGGFIIFFISRRNVLEQEKERYNSYVELANKEIFDTTYPLFEESHIPGVDSIRAIIGSTAKKYKVKIQDLYTYETLAYDSVKKIMSSNSFTPKQRKEIPDIIMKEIRKENKKRKKEISAPVVYRTKEDSSKRMNQFGLIFAFVGMILGLITVINSFLYDTQQITTEIDLTLLYIILIIFITILLSIIVPWILRKTMTKKKGEQEFSKKIREEDLNNGGE